MTTEGRGSRIGRGVNSRAGVGGGGRGGDASPLPMGKSPRPVAASPRFEGLYFNQAKTEAKPGDFSPTAASSKPALVRTVFKPTKLVEQFDRIPTSDPNKDEDIPTGLLPPAVLRPTGSNISGAPAADRSNQTKTFLG